VDRDQYPSDENCDHDQDREKAIAWLQCACAIAI